MKVLKGIPEDKELEIFLPALEQFTICLRIKQLQFSSEYQSILVTDSFETGLFPGKECQRMEDLNSKKSKGEEVLKQLKFFRM